MTKKIPFLPALAEKGCFINEKNVHSLEASYIDFRDK